MEHWLTDAVLAAIIAGAIVGAGVVLWRVRQQERRVHEALDHITPMRTDDIEIILYDLRNGKPLFDERTTQRIIHGLENELQRRELVNGTSPMEG